jgi:hypothetical protein
MWMSGRGGRVSPSDAQRLAGFLDSDNFLTQSARQFFAPPTGEAAHENAQEHH